MSKTKTTNHPKSPETTHASTSTHATPAFQAPDLKVAIAWIQPKLADVVDPRPFRADIEASCVAALAVCERCHAPALRTRFKNLASINEFDFQALEDLPLLTVGVRQLRVLADQAIAQAAGGKLPPSLLTKVDEVETRMQDCCEHTLSAIPAAEKELARLAPGTGPKDDANDLEGYANLYEKYPDEVKLDGVNYRSGDVTRARDLAKELLSGLAAAQTPATKKSLEDLHRGATLFLRRYEQVAFAGSFLVGEAEAATQFPSLHAAGRAKRRRGKANPPVPPVPPAEGAPPGK